MKVDGKKISLCREERAWTQRHLADAARVSLRTVQRMEKDGIGSKESLMSIAAALDLSVDDFLIAGNHKSTETFGNPLRFYLRVGGLFFILLVLASSLFIAWDYSMLYAVARPGDMHAFHETYFPYQKILSGLGIILACYLSIWAATIAVSYRMLTGVLAFGAGILIILVAFSFLPWIQFPHDQYPASMLWLFTSLVPAVICGIFAFALLKAVRHHGYFNPMHVVN